jgi:hypothetical protein
MSPFTEPQHSLGDESKILEAEHARAIGPMAMKSLSFLAFLLSLLLLLLWSSGA